MSWMREGRAQYAGLSFLSLFFFFFSFFFFSCIPSECGTIDTSPVISYSTACVVFYPMRKRRSRCAQHFLATDLLPNCTHWHLQTFLS